MSNRQTKIALVAIAAGVEFISAYAAGQKTNSEVARNFKLATDLAAAGGYLNGFASGVDATQYRGSEENSYGDILEAAKALPLTTDQPLQAIETPQPMTADGSPIPTPEPCSEPKPAKAPKPKPAPVEFADDQDEDDDEPEVEEVKPAKAKKAKPAPEDDDEDDEEEAPEPAPKRRGRPAKPAPAPEPPAKKRGRPAKPAPADEDDEDEDDVAPSVD